MTSFWIANNETIFHLLPDCQHVKSMVMPEKQETEEIELDNEGLPVKVPEGMTLCHDCRSTIKARAKTRRQLD